MKKIIDEKGNYALTGYNIPTKEQFEDEGEL